MKKYVSILTLITCTSIWCFSQKYIDKNYSWEKEIPKYTLSEEEKKFGEVCIEEKKIIEIEATETGVVQYYLLHEINLVNSSDAIERNNRLRIPYSSNAELLLNKLRVILPDGKTIELTEDDIKEAEDEEQERKYKYYAVRGLVEGALIERIILKKSEPDLTGSLYYMQSEQPSKWQSFDLIYPDFLKMDFKIYNMPGTEISTDTMLDGLTRKYIHLENVSALPEEKYSNYLSNLKSVAYKMTGNYSTGKYNLFSFKSIVDGIYPILNPDLTKEDKKVLDKFLSKTTFTSSDTEADKIRKIEDLVKSNVVSGEKVNVKDQSIADMLKVKVTNHMGMTRLFCCIFNHLGIKHHEVLSINRFKRVFDPKFEDYDYLDEYIIYFPGNYYLAPNDMLGRYPFIPDGIANNYGLFMKPVELSGVVMGAAEKRKIETLDYTRSIDTMDITIDLTQDLAHPNVTYKLVWTGYMAARIQPFMQLMEEKDKDKFRKQILEGFAGDLTNITIKTENEGIDNFGIKPFIATVTTPNQNIIEKVGDSYLIKVGETIGPQVEMYQQGERKTPISIEHAHVYYRFIKVILPTGYVLKGTEKADINKTCSLNNEIAARFITSYKTNNNEFVITNEESYRILDIPITQYEDFKGVVNAAADFNKIVLILEPK